MAKILRIPPSPYVKVTVEFTPPEGGDKLTMVFEKMKEQEYDISQADAPTLLMIERILGTIGATITDEDWDKK